MYVHSHINHRHNEAYRKVPESGEVARTSPDNSTSRDRAIVNHVIDYFSTAGDPYNRWENSEKYVISIYIVDWVIILP
jgi:hypothetical protein